METKEEGGVKGEKKECVSFETCIAEFWKKQNLSSRQIKLTELLLGRLATTDEHDWWQVILSCHGAGISFIEQLLMTHWRQEDICRNPLDDCPDLPRESKHPIFITRNEETKVSKMQQIIAGEQLLVCKKCKEHDNARLIKMCPGIRLDPLKLDVFGGSMARRSYIVELQVEAEFPVFVQAEAAAYWKRLSDAYIKLISTERRNGERSFWELSVLPDL